MNDRLIKPEINTWRLENSKYIYWIIGAALIFKIIAVLILIVSGRSYTEQFTPEALVFDLSIIFIPLFTVNVIYFIKKWAGHYCNSPFKLILLKLSATIIGVIISTAIVEYITYLAGVVDDDYIGIGSFNLSVIETNFVTNIFFSLLVGMPIFLRQSSEDRDKMKLMEKERELDKAYQLKIKSELDAIHAKINPHFLYNSLNSIVSLIHENPNKAEKMVLSLSDLFRYSINSGDEDFTTVKNEIELVSNYLDIEHVRFQDRLDIEIAVEPETEGLLIPKFLIQPLVENAIKYGISKVKKGLIRIEVKRMNEFLELSVFDNGPDFPDNINSGYGFKSTVDKLELLYRDGYSFKILNTPKKRIEIILNTNRIKKDEKI